MEGKALKPLAVSFNGGPANYLTFKTRAIINLLNAMRNCSRLFKGLNYAPNMNSPDLVKTIAKMLPPKLLFKWTGKASHYLK